MQSMAAGALGASSSVTASLFSRSMLAFPPAVFDAGATTAIVSVIGNRAVSVHVRWAPTASFQPTNSIRSESVTLLASNDFAHAFVLTKLPSNSDVSYAIYSGEDVVSPTQRFRTAPAASTRSDVSLAFSGDMEERYRPFAVFDQIARQKVDAFIHLGDTVYADIPRRDFTPSVAHYRRKHAAIRADGSLQSFMANHSMIATWDDHEIENDCHAGHPAMADAAKVFAEYWPTSAQSGVGLYRNVRFGSDVELFMLDTRRFRSAQSDVDSAQKTMLGAVQKRAFFRDFGSSAAKFRLIGTSVPVHGASADAWGNYATERDELLDAFRKANASSGSKTIILSADYHFAREWPRSEKFGIYEFMAGPLAAFLTFETDNNARSRHTRGAHFVFGDRPNFGVLRYRAVDRSLHLSYFDDRGTLLHERHL